MRAQVLFNSCTELASAYRPHPTYWPMETTTTISACAMCSLMLRSDYDRKSSFGSEDG
jgi:hypothetical protein